MAERAARTALAAAVALPLGVLAATRPGSWIDHGARLLTTAGVCLPVFFTGLLLVYIFYYLLGWAPAPLGRLDTVVTPPAPVTGSFLVDSLLMGDLGLLWACARQLVLPALTLGVFAMAPIARMTRALMLDVLSQDYIRTGHAKGLSFRVVVYKHALKNALIPAVTITGLSIGELLGGAILTETIFDWPGMGKYVVDSVNFLDFPAIMGFTLVVSLVYVIINLVVDVLYALLDPQIRY